MKVAARVALCALLAVPFFWGLAGEEFHGDESHWVSSGRRGWWLVTTGRWWDEEWREEFYFYSQPQVGKLLIGAAQAAAGISGEAPVYDYDWQRLPEENAAEGRVPEGRALVVSRVPSAVLGWAGCLVVWWLAGVIGAPAAGPIAAVLLASQPLWLANARRAGLDVPSLTLGVAAAGAVWEALRRRSGGWWVAAGGLAGLSVGTKYVGALAVALAGPLVVMHVWRERRRPRPAEAAGAMVALGVAAAVFIGTNPALWPDPLRGVNTSLGFLSGQAEGMRQTIPEFRSPLWVAAQMVDRALWPLGAPRVVERSMPEPLEPGTYGTPVVGMGVVLALLRARRPAAAVAAAWCALVFVALAVSLPTWWERWHLPLVPPLALLAGIGLAKLPRAALPRVVTPNGGGHRRASLGWALAGAQYAGALALLPSYLSRGFGHLVMTPVGAAAHLGALAWTLATLVSLALFQIRAAREKKDGGAQDGG